MFDIDFHFSNRTHFRTCGRFWLSSVKLSGSVADELKKDRKKKKNRDKTKGQRLCRAA